MRGFDFLNPENPIDNEFCILKEEDTINSFDYSSIHRSEYFNEAMNHFDITDKMTRNILLSVNEADQNTVMVSLSNKLYEHIVNKVDDIDFGTIPLSKGDVTRIDNYEELVDCIKTMDEILQQYNQDTGNIEIIAESLQNVIDRVDLFTKAYRLNVEMPIIIYNTITLSIISATSLMIASCIEFIKNSSNQSFEIACDKTYLTRTKDSILFKNLAKFNKTCSDGSFDKSMEFVINQNTKNFTGLGVGYAAMALGSLLLIIPVIRELIFFLYYARFKVSDYFDMQSSLLTMNAYNIENNLTTDPKEKKKIVDKQKKISDMFKKISNKFKVDSRTAEAKSAKDISKLNADKYKYSDVSNTIPDSSNSVLF